MERMRLLSVFQKQPPEVIYKKSCSKKFGNFHQKTPVLEFIFSKVAVALLKNLRCRCFLLNIEKILRTPILKNICEWPLLVL